MSGTIVIGHIRVLDAEKWEQYRRAVPATLAPWQGTLVLRGRDAQPLNGPHAHTDTVVLRFPDRAAADGWYGSDAYQSLVPLRTDAADVLLIRYEEST